jgi:hypothetical protein
LCVVEDKQKLQETLFPGGIYFDKKNHCYLTRNINNFMLLSSSLSMSCEGKKNEDKPSNYDLSSSLAGARLERRPSADGYEPNELKNLKTKKDLR